MKKSEIPDIQKTKDTREVYIPNVGVTGIVLPVSVVRLDGTAQATVGKFELSVSLDAVTKGTHMSRFTEVLNEFTTKRGTLSTQVLSDMTDELRKRLDAESACVKMECDYFVMQKSPEAKREGVAPVKARVSITRNDAPFNSECVSVGVTVEGKTVCPCSKEISDYNAATQTGKGAHAQRSQIKIDVDTYDGNIIWFETLIDIAMKAFSSPVFPVLKREDERAVTMAAYANPKFVEDVIRDAVVQLRGMGDAIANFRVRVENAESIHYHNAFAECSE